MRTSCAEKRVNVATGAAELVWYDIQGSSSTVTLPAYGGPYVDILQWYQILQDLIQQGPPQGYTDPIIVIDWDPTFGDWKYLDLANLDYWPRGEDETKCYGSAIGDGSQNKVIDLDGKALVGGDWATQYGLSVGNGLTVGGTGTFTGEIVADGGVNTQSLNVRNNFLKLNTGDVYAPQTVSIGGTNYTLLVKQ